MREWYKSGKEIHLIPFTLHSTITLRRLVAHLFFFFFLFTWHDRHHHSTPQHDSSFATICSRSGYFLFLPHLTLCQQPLSLYSLWQHMLCAVIWCILRVFSGHSGYSYTTWQGQSNTGSFTGKKTWERKANKSLIRCIDRERILAKRLASWERIAMQLYHRKPKRLWESGRMTLCRVQKLAKVLNMGLYWSWQLTLCDSNYNTEQQYHIKRKQWANNSSTIISCFIHCCFTKITYFREWSSKNYQIRWCQISVNRQWPKR